MVKKTPAYKNKLRALELERSGGITNKKKGQKNKDRYGIILILYSPCVWFPISYVYWPFQFGVPPCKLLFPLLNQFLFDS